MPRTGGERHTVLVHNLPRTDATKGAHKTAQPTSISLSLDADTGYRNLQLRIASEKEAEAANQEFMRAKEAAA